MSIRVPFTAEAPIRDAFLDVEQRLRELEAREDPTEDLEIQIQALRDELERLRTRRNSPDPRDIMVASGTMHSPGLVPDPPSTAGTTKFLREDGTWVAVVGGGGTSPLTTKGDIWGYTTTDARVGVGTNDTVLKADSGQAAGVIWEKVAASETTFAATTQIDADDVQEALDELGATHGLVNIKYVPPGTGTLTTAVAAMSLGDILVLGAGTYTCASVDIPDAVTSFGIIGQGPGSTFINITGGGIGINAADARRNKAVLRGFTLKPSGANLTWGISIWGRSTNSYVNPFILVKDVALERSVANEHFTSGGLDLINCFEARVENVSVRNKASDYIGVGIQLESCVVCNIISCFTTETASAFKMIRPVYTLVENATADDDVTHHGCEGNRFIGCECYISTYGWNLGTRSLDNSFVDGTLAVCTDNNVKDTDADLKSLEGYNMISGCWTDGMTAASAASVAAKMPGWKIVDNTFNGPNDTSKNTLGVAFIADTADRAIVSGNIFRYHDYGIYNDGADYCLFTNNIFENMTANDTGVYCLAGGNYNISAGNQYYNSPGYTDGGTGNVFWTEANWTDLTDGGDTTLHVHSIYAALAGATFTGDVSLTSATTEKPVLALTNTNADATGGYVTLQKDSASPAASDVMGTILFKSDDSAGNVTDMAYIKGVVVDPTNTSEDGRLEIYGITAGSVGNAASITGDAAASTAPSLYAYFKPITAKYRADTDSTGALVWDTTVSADAKFSVASSTNVTVSEAGTYHVGALVSITLNNTTATVSLLRYNSSNALQETSTASLETSANRDTSCTFSEVFTCAAGDYFKVTFSAGTIVAADASNQFSIQRLN